MKCPCCTEKIPGWKVCLITRWTSITCTSCAASLNRRVDLQLFIIGLILTAVVILANNLADTLMIQSLIIVGGVAFAWLADSFTVRLVPNQKGHTGRNDA